MSLQRKLNDPADMNYDQQDQPDDIDLLQKKLEDASGKLKALEQYANSLRLLRAKQTEQHARLEDKVQQLEQECTLAKETSERQLQSEVSRKDDHESKLAELQTAYTQSQQELKAKILEIESLTEKQTSGNHETNHQVAELHQRLEALHAENQQLKENLTELQILRKQLSEINEATTQTEQEKQNALEQVSILSTQVEELKQMAQECSDLVDSEQDKQAQIAKTELNEIQAELHRIRAQAREDIKTMREQMQQSADDTTRLITDLEEEKQRITELELMAHPLSLTGNEQQQSATALPQPHETINHPPPLDKKFVDRRAPHHLAANGLVATILISTLCAMVLTMVFLFATEGGRDFLASYLEQRQGQIKKTDDQLSLHRTKPCFFV